MKYLKSIVLIILLPFFTSGQQKERQVSDYRDLMDSIELKQLDTNIFNYAWRFSFGNGNNIGYVDYDAELFIHKTAFSGERIRYNFPDSTKGFPFYAIAQNEHGDFYYLNSDGHLYRLSKDSESELLENFAQNKVLIENGLMIENLLGMDRNFHFYNDSVLVIPVKWDLNRDKGKYTNYKKPCPAFITYHVQSKKLIINDIWTKPQTIKTYYPDRNFNYSVMANGKLLVSVPYSSQIQVLDVRNNTVEKKFIEKSQFQTDSIRPLDAPSKKKKIALRDRYLIEEAYYGPIVYNPFRNEYYRIFYHSLPTKNENGDYTIYTDKSSSIMVFDINLKLKNEIYFDKNYFIFLGLTPTKDGIIFNSILSKHDGRFFIKTLIW